MLAPAPYQVPVKGDKTESGKAKGGLPSKGTSDTVPEEIKILPSEGQSEGEANIPSPHGKKRAASEGWEEKAPKRGKMLPLGGPGLEGDVIAWSHGEDKPSGKP